MKRRAIIIVTFIAGLYYLLEFLLPARIGGSPDADGADAATLIVAGDERYIAYSGLRTDRRPEILRTAEDGSGPRTRLIAPHFARRDDYRGAIAPQFVPPDRIYYLGLGWDDRTPRVCLARLVEGRWRPEPRAALSNGAPGAPDASGILWASVLPPPGRQGLWRMWYVGLQGDRGTLCVAESQDGIAWTKRGPAQLPLQSDIAVRCVNALRDEAGVVLWLLVRRDGRDGRVLAVRLGDDELTSRGPPAEVEAYLPRGAEMLSFRLFRTEQPGVAGYAGLANVQGPVCVASLAHLPEERGQARISVANPILLTPGPKPRSTLLSDIRMQVDDILVVIGAFAVGLGLIGLAQVHGKRVLALHKGWLESLAFFVAAFAMASFTVYARTHPDARTWGTRGYDLMFYGMLQPLGSSMFSLLAAYLVSAAYRAFRVRTFEGGLLAASATLIMLGQVPVGNWLTQNLPPYMQIPKVMAWVLFVNNTAVVRAVNFGIFVGALATALRVWLSMDRASMRSIE